MRRILQRAWWGGCMAAALSASGAELVPFSATWAFRPGLGEASDPVAAWRGVAFDDAAFSDAPAPFWYGDVRTGGTELTDMRGSYSSFFLRRTFQVTDPTQVASLVLSAYVDDGFVAWINGTEVARENFIPLNPVVSDTAETYNPEPVPIIPYPLPPPGTYLRAGTNVLAVQVFNSSLGDSSDVGFDCTLDATLLETDPPVVLSVEPPPGTVPSLTTLTVTFSEPVVGVDAWDLRVNGDPGIELNHDGIRYTFALAEPPEGTVSVAWAANHGITDLATPGNRFDADEPEAQWTYILTDTVAPTVHRTFPAPGATIRSLGQIDITFTETMLGLDPGDLRINGTPASTLVTLPDGTYRFQFTSPAEGPVSVVWGAGHAITDNAALPNPFAGGSWAYTVDPDLPEAELRITEFLAANTGGRGSLDEDGEAQDWIEIHNPGSVAVDLADWSLSDDPAIPGLWPFPSRILGPDEYLLVFASGKNRTPLNGELHTNFKLSVAGEFLGLYTPDSPRVLASGFADVPEQRSNVAYGLDPDGVPRHLAIPTPEFANQPSTLLGVVDPVHVNVRRGLFSTPFDLVLSCATPGVVIRYTTDGSPPTETSSVFPDRLSISQTTLFRAAGFKDRHLPSRTVTHSYLFDVREDLRSVPIVSIVTDQNHLTGPAGIVNMANVNNHGLAWERPTSVEWIEPGDHEGFQIDCGIRLQGSDYHRGVLTPASKFSFRLYFRGDYGPGRLTYPLFPLTPVDRFDGLVLRGGLNEQGNPFIRDELTRRLSHDMGQVASHGTMAVVFINGQPWDNSNEPSKSPVYNPCERIHEEFLQEHLGGSEEWDVTKPFWGATVDGSWADFEAMYTFVRSDADVSDPSDYTRISQWLDLTNFVDYVILNTYAATGDWPNNNWRAGRDQAPDGIWRFIVWDAEWAMGIYGRSVQMNNFTLAGGGPQDSGLAGNSPIALIYQGLRPSREFQLLWSDRLQRHFYHGGALSRENITNRFEELETDLSMLIPNMNDDLLDWARDRQPIYLDQCGQQGLLSRVDVPVFGQHGGRVPAEYALSMSAPEGTVYYTLDGSDPRTKFTGAIGDTAVAYTDPVPLAGSVTVRARVRVRNGSVWSAQVEAEFQVASLGIPFRITEIMYNPAGGSLYEFVELANLSDRTLDLGGMTLSGIDFTFPLGARLDPGERLVLGSDTAPMAWALRYPGVAVAGWFPGTLSNGGERLTLLDPNGNTITSVDYQDGGGWPEAADDDGRSLEVLDPIGNPDDPANWLASPTPAGSPGQAPLEPGPSPVLLNELMAENAGAVSHGGTTPDWIELANPDPAPVDLAGWSLSDDGNERKFVFPAGTELPGYGRLVIWCDAVTNATPGLHAGFALDNDGETIRLFDAATNRVDAVTYGLQIPDWTVGRSGGEWTLTAPTPGMTNVVARLADPDHVGINEWLADPVPGEDDWFELFNRSANRPVGIGGLYAQVGEEIARFPDLSFLPPFGYAQIRADGGVGPNHLDLRLPAAGALLSLFDTTGALLEQVAYPSQSEGVSQGRLPDGTFNQISFPSTASPGAPNYVDTQNGVILSEVLARSQSVVVDDRVTDFVELHNPTDTTVDLSGMSLSADKPNPGVWVFPAGTLLRADDYLVIPCDGSRQASTASGAWNLGESLDGQSGGAYLYDAAGRLMDSIVYGPQITDMAIGTGDGLWRLQLSPSPGRPNPGPASLGEPTTLRINEWMASPDTGPDWFELYNPSPHPVDLSRISLTDDPSLAGVARFLPAPLSFIAPEGFVTWVADARPGDGRNHVNFGIDGRGETLLVYGVGGDGSYSLIDGVSFGAQEPDTSAGSLPDGAGYVETFPGSSSPGRTNYRLLTWVVINEILAHTDPPLEDAVELYNPTDQDIDLGGWVLGHGDTPWIGFRFPPGTILPARGYLVGYETQFNDGSPSAFALNAAHGDEVWLSESTPAGEATGFRVVAEVGASFNGVSFGRVDTAAGVDYPALSRTSFGVDDPVDPEAFRTGTGEVNAVPTVGPVILNEIHYHPDDSLPGDRAFVELLNQGTNAVPLYDPAYPANPWRLGGGLLYAFPADTVLAAGESVVVVAFDPTADSETLAAFQSLHVVPPSVRFFGPFAGRLDNDRDEVILYRPDTPQSPSAPDPDYVPQVVADRVAYRDDAPWPADDVDGGGDSLQRVRPEVYGNEPRNWLGAPPSPGDANHGLWIDTDQDQIPDAAERAWGLHPDNPADGPTDADGDGISNRDEFLAGTDPLDPLDDLRLHHTLGGEPVQLSFPAAAGRAYTVFYTDSLLQPAWSELDDLPAEPIYRRRMVPDPTPTDESRFYLLTVPEETTP